MTTTLSAYTIPELNRLFQSSLFDVPANERLNPKHTLISTFRWLIPIALFSGLRLNEACRLAVDDLRCQDNIWFFDVHNRSFGKPLKTQGAIRVVPMHDELVRIGLVKYLNALPSGNLFPAIKLAGHFSEQASKYFTMYRRRIGLNRTGLSFQSLRQNFTTALQRAGIPMSDIKALLGRSQEFSVDMYGGGLRLRALLQMIERVNYAGLDLKYLYIE